ncbi:histidinol dehydrogenase [Pseudemcibacter aquimaris]|uniref:histidinol dehydrogenase n=1 Tax=Pseudemcibacter aquimaris TaxID=2857064 RepID=UPI002012BB91|nr:histidinol dehydrogenase [Pseudemcibacter aquimaris]MCC3861166.1 histidinol dehydrogenase [Pseudemcibacter aquimaris]WDU57941.1 histidinol dehydrogenase [Pseudemcibacter aquimaris]
MVNQLNTKDAGFSDAFSELLKANRNTENDVSGVVKEILKDVRENGNKALFDYTSKFDNLELNEDTMRVSDAEINAALEQVSVETMDALKIAAKRISDFHIRHIPEDDDMTDEQGVRLGVRWNAVGAAGIYVPGGKAAYPSSVLMNAIPAKAAGVERIIMVVPCPNGELNPLVLAAAQVSGITEIYKIGGAQAVGALAYGTETINAVDVIAGPGNAYVAAAKKEVFGTVGIDMIAGPSEILVVADNQNDPKWIAMDLLSQAEHDEVAQSILITDDADYAKDVIAAVDGHLKTLPRAEIARTSWENHGCVIIVDNLDDAPALIDQIAPEHLEVAVEDARGFTVKIRNAGSIFIGRYTPEAIGDYIAGPNHVLPTSGSARFSSGLSVLDFMKRNTLIECDADNLAVIGPPAMSLADEEGLDAHKHSIGIRLK